MTSVRLFLVCALVAACAPRPPVAGAPCECPADYICTLENKCHANACPCPTGFLCNDQGTCDVSPDAGAEFEISESCANNLVFPPARQFPLFPKQYLQTLAVLTGSQPSAFEPPTYASQSGDKFTTSTALTLRVSSSEAAVFERNARKAAETLLSGPMRAGGCAPEDPSTESACRGLLIARASGAYRKPLSEADRIQLENLLDRASPKFGFKEALLLALEAALQSPQFLYRSEVGENEEAGLTTLTNYEIASALSYDLTDAPPDGLLLNDAQLGRLSVAKARGEHARRLLATPAAQRKFREFFFQLFLLNKAVNLEGKPEGFEAVLHSMQLETSAFVDRYLWEDGANLTTLFTSTTTWVDARLASHYGVAAPANVEQGGWITIPERKGLLANGRVLAAYPNPRRRLPIRRGLMVIENLQCESLPPPALTPDLRITPGELPADSTARELAQSFFAMNSGGSCQNCHSVITDLSLAFEHFDEVGRYRTQEFGKAIDARYEDQDLGVFQNGLDYAEAVMKTSKGQECLVRHLASYALGVENRSEANQAACLAERLYPRWSAGGLHFTDLLVRMVEDETFIKRRFIR